MKLVKKESGRYGLLRREKELVGYLYLYEKFRKGEVGLFLGERLLSWRELQLSRGCWAVLISFSLDCNLITFSSILKNSQYTRGFG